MATFASRGLGIGSAMLIVVLSAFAARSEKLSQSCLYHMVLRLVVGIMARHQLVLDGFLPVTVAR